MIITNDIELARKIIDIKIRNAPLEDLYDELHSIEIEIVGSTKFLIEAIKEHNENRIESLIKDLDLYYDKRNYY